jgi:soluble lytic murein transglycosylase-like protein
MIRQTTILQIWGTIVFSSLLLAACFFISVHFPVDPLAAIPDTADQTASNVPIIYEEDNFEEFVRFADSTGIAYPVVFYKTVAQSPREQDAGLALYRSVKSRGAVEWFYTHLTNDPAVTQAILEYADENDIPFSLAFSLAYAESRYKPTAMHKNDNGSVDRGLFQLNNNSFPELSEADFFNPRTSAQYGMEYLRFCLDTAGNEVSALAMYNAGTTKVRSDNTPRRTLNYISDILASRDAIEDLFQSKVVEFFAVE